MSNYTSSLKQLRKHFKMNIMELSDKSGVSMEVIRKIDGQDDDVLLRDVIALANYFRVSVGSLIINTPTEIAPVSSNKGVNDGLVLPPINLYDEVKQIINNSSQKISASERWRVAYCEKLGLSARAANCLARGGVATFEQFMALAENEIANIRNIGKSTTEEIVAAQNRLNYIKEHGTEPPKKHLPQSPKKPKEPKEWEQGIYKELGLAPSVARILYFSKHNIKCADDFTKLTWAELGDMPGVGGHTIQKVYAEQKRVAAEHSTMPAVPPDKTPQYVREGQKRLVEQYAIEQTEKK